MHGFDVEGVGAARDGGGQGDGGVVMDEDGEWEGWVRRRGLEREDDVVYCDGEGKVEGVASDAAALVEAVGLEVWDEDGAGLDVRWARGGVEEQEVYERVDVGLVGIFIVDGVLEGVENGGAANSGVGVDDVYEVVYEGGVQFSVQLHAVDRSVAA